mgnify:CR=1 FL=1
MSSKINIRGEDQNSIIRVLNLYKYLSTKRKNQIYVNIFLTIISSIAEIFSVAIILPFLTLITNPNDFEKLPILSNFYYSFYPNNINRFIIYLTLIFLFIIIVSIFIKLYQLRFTIKLAESIGVDIGKKVFKNVLNKDYSDLVNINSSDLITDININVNGSIIAIDALLRMISSIFLSLSILVALLIINRNITIFTFLILLCSYLIINTYSKKILVENSKKIVSLQPFKYKYLQESLGGIREVILSNLQNYYVYRFEKVERKIRNLLFRSGFVTNSYRFIIEGIVMILICLIAVSVLYLDKSSIAVLGTFAIGSQKLLPSLQAIFRLLSNIRGKKFEVLKTLELLSGEENIYSVNIKNNINFENKIFLKNISFRHTCKKEFLFKRVNLEITKGEILGIIGESGSGKSTLADILMTLLRPESGSYFLDNVNLYDSPMEGNLLKWRSFISQVPQNIFLTDSSIAENIAYGINKEDIDLIKLSNASKLAGLNKFIDTLPLKYETIVGEGGAFLSGGQRQRIAIARALYKNAKLLILDEATSSLDNDTEDIIIESLKAIKGKITIILISHRLRTLEICDRVVEVRNGLIEEKKREDF